MSRSESQNSSQPPSCSCRSKKKVKYVHEALKQVRVLARVNKHG